MGQIVACSDCFKDYGLRQTALGRGRQTCDPCPFCKSKTGRKLDRDALTDVCSSYFVSGSVPSGRGIFAPVIQVNDTGRESDFFGTHELNADIHLLRKAHTISCFYYGPPLWAFGKPPDEDGSVTWVDQDFNYVIDNCADRHLTAEDIFHRVQLDLRDEEISPIRFCSPPDEVRQRFWRFDSAKTRICYAALDVETCLHESRVTLQHSIFVAALRPLRSLRLLDLGACHRPAGATQFDDPCVWLRSLLYDGEDSYNICRRFADQIQCRDYDGFVYSQLLSAGG